MKVIWGPVDANGDRWLAVVPDDASSCQDPRRRKVVAPAYVKLPPQIAWLEGYSQAVKDGLTD